MEQNKIGLQQNKKFSEMQFYITYSWINLHFFSVLFWHVESNQPALH